MAELEVRINDAIAGSIQQKIDAIGDAASVANARVKELRDSLKIGDLKLGNVTTAAAKDAALIEKLRLQQVTANQKIQQEIAKTLKLQNLAEESRQKSLKATNAVSDQAALQAIALIERQQRADASKTASQIRSAESVKRSLLATEAAAARTAIAINALAVAYDKGTASSLNYQRANSEIAKRLNVAQAAASSQIASLSNLSREEAAMRLRASQVAKSKNDLAASNLRLISPAVSAETALNKLAISYDKLTGSAESYKLSQSRVSSAIAAAQTSAASQIANLPKVTVKYAADTQRANEVIKSTNQVVKSNLQLVPAAVAAETAINQLAVAYSKYAISTQAAGEAARRVSSRMDLARKSALLQQADTPILSPQKQAEAIARNQLAVSNNAVVISQNRLAESAARTALAELRLSQALNKNAGTGQRLAGIFGILGLAQDKLASSATRGMGIFATSSIGIDRFENSIRRASQTIRSFASGFLLLSAGWGALNRLDASQQIENSLRLVSEVRNSVGNRDELASQQRLLVLSNEIYAASERSRTSATAFAAAFSKIDAALGPLGYSMKETIGITESFASAMSAAGISTNAQISVMQQLAQAFSSGVLSGDEFRTLRENAPVFIRELAKSLNTDLGGLNRLAEQQKLTNRNLAEGASRTLKLVQEQLTNAPRTIGQAWTQLTNRITQFFGELDKSAGVTRSIVAFFDYCKQNLPEIARGFAAVAAAIGSMFAVQNTAGVVGAVTTLVSILGKGLLAVGSGLTGGVGGILGSLPQLGSALKDIISLLNTGLVAGIVGGSAYFTYFADQIKVTADGAVTLEDRLKAIASVLSDAIFGTPLGIFNADAAQSGYDKLVGFLDNLKTYAIAVAAAFEHMRQRILAAYNTFLKLPAEKITKFFEPLTEKLQRLGSIVAPAFRESELSRENRLQMEKIDNAAIIDSPKSKLQSYQQIFDEMIAGVKKIETSITKKETEIASTRKADEFQTFLDKIDAQNDLYLRQADAVQKAQSEMKKLNEETKANYFDEAGQSISGFNNYIDRLQEGLSGINKDGFNRLLQLQNQIRENNIRSAIKADPEAFRKQGIFSKAFIDKTAGVSSSTAAATATESAQSSATKLQSTLSSLVPTVNQVTSGIQNMDSLSSQAFILLQASIANVSNDVPSLVTTFSSGTDTMKNSIENVTASINALSDAIRNIPSLPPLNTGGVPSLGNQPSGSSNATFGGGFGALGEPTSATYFGGYASGGYTGDGSSTSIAGFVHRKEFVVPEGPAQKYRPMLEAMRSGKLSQSSQTVGRSDPSPLNVTIQNYGGSQVETRRLSDTEILVLIDQKARAIARSEAPRAVASQIRNPNSHVSKSISQSTNTERRR